MKTSFRKQRPVLKGIADFVLKELKVITEVGGDAPRCSRAFCDNEKKVSRKKDLRLSGSLTMKPSET